MISTLKSSFRVTIATLFMLLSSNLFAPVTTHATGYHSDNKVTICHATDSVVNPYNQETVDEDAADGNTGNDNGQGDHSEHTGPIATSQTVAQALKDSHTAWGDIIPPHDNYAGLNWTAQGQAIWYNDCSYVPASVTPTAPTFNDACGLANDTYTIPATTGVTYKVNGFTKAAGTYAGFGLIVINAYAESGYTLSGTTVWSHWFTNVTCPPAEVTPAAPTSVDLTCEEDGSYTIPSTTGVQYKVNGNVVAAGTYTVSTAGDVVVKAYALPGYTLTGTTTWTLSFHNPEDCEQPPVEVTPPAPTNTDFECDIMGSYTIPKAEGVEYLINGQVVADGTYKVQSTDDIVVTAQALPGYTLTGTTTWTMTFDAPSTEDCEQELPVDVCPNIQGTQTSVPSSMVLSNGNCVADAGSVLGISTTTPNTPVVQGVKQLANTGENPMVDILIGTAIFSLAIGSSILTRRANLS